MDVCYLGYFDPEYPRNQVLIRALRSQELSVGICRVGGSKRSPKRYWKLISAFTADFAGVDLIVVGTPGNYDVPVAKYLSERYDIPVVYDSYASAYDTQVLDRENATKGSIKSHYYRLLDRITCHLPDVVLVDTLETKEFFVNEYDTDPAKVCALAHGTNDQLFYPRSEDPDEEKETTVWFHGNHIPLQGVQYIVRAAKQLEHRDVTFRLVGTGQTYDEVTRIVQSENVTNVERIDWLEYETLPDRIASAEICLGIFGTSGKAGRVIPNKVYEYLAMGRPVITGRSPAMERVFDHKEHVYLCERGDPDAITVAIETLLDEKGLRNRIAKAGLQRYNELFRTEMVGKRFQKIVAETTGV